MKKSSLFPALVSLLAVSAAQMVQAQETSLQVGRAGYGPADPPVVHSASTAQIDPILNLINPAQFGAHYTRDVANAMFADLDAYGERIRAQVAPIVAQQPDVIGTPQIIVNSNPLNLELWQNYQGLAVQVWGLSMVVKLDYRAGHGELCGIAHGTVRLNKIIFTSQYSIATGQLQGSNVSWELGDISVDCSGDLGFIGEGLYHLFAANNLRQSIQQQVDAALKEKMHMLDSRTVFSAYNMLEGLRVVIPNPVLNSMADEVITIAQGVVLNPASLNKSVRLNMSVTRAPTGNVVRFVASNATHSQVDFIDYPRGRTVVTLGVADNIGRSDVFYRYPAGTGPWYLLGSTTTNVLDVPGSYPIGTEIGAIGLNYYHPNLRSDLGITRVTEYSSNCTHNCTPQEPE